MAAPVDLLTAVDPADPSGSPAADGDGRPLVVQLDRVAYTYPGPPPVTALHPTDLAIHAGEYVAITGASGSGKSTLLNLIGLLDRPTEGHVVLDNVDTSDLAERERTALRGTRIGFVFQAFHLLPYRSALDNVMLAGLYAGVRRRERARRGLTALGRVGLAHRASALPSELSGGERQRVAIARALAHQPALLLCDEPTGNLDSETTEGILDLLDEVNRQDVTVLVITHDPLVAARAGRRVGIKDGHLAELP